MIATSLIVAVMIADAALPIASPTILTVIATTAVAAVTAAWAWFRDELNECKRDRKEMFARIEALHGQLTELAIRVGNVEGRKGQP
jgi:hypothetical protein